MDALVVLAFVMVAFYPLHGSGKLYPSVQWTPQNPVFNSSTGHLKMEVLSMSKINLICPNTAIVIAQMEDSIQKEKLYENVWIVDKESFENCSVNASNSNNRRLMACDSPLKLKFYTIVFQPFSADIKDPEFDPGRSYYFIATSDGSKASLSNTQKGHCEGGMKMEVYVCEDEKDCEVSKTTTAPSITKVIPKILKNVHVPSLDNVATSVATTTSSVNGTVLPPAARESVNTSPPRHEDDSKISTLLVVIGILSVALAGCIVMIAYLYLNRRRAKRDSKEESKPGKKCRLNPFTPELKIQILPTIK